MEDPRILEVAILSEEKQLRILPIALAVIAVFILSDAVKVEASAGWIFYWDKSYQGKVIETETREPIEGAVVVAVYTVSCYRFIQTNSKEVGVQEVLTKTDGTFRLPSFWTITTPECLPSHTWLTVFKPRYSQGQGAFEIYATTFPRRGKEGLVYNGGSSRWHRAMEDQSKREVDELLRRSLERDMAKAPDEKRREELQKNHERTMEYYERLYAKDKISETMVPFLSLPDAKARLASMEIPLPATHEFPENAELIDLKFFPLSLMDIDYRVIGLSRLRTREDLERFYPPNPVSSDRLRKKLKIFLNLEIELREMQDDLEPFQRLERSGMKPPGHQP